MFSLKRANECRVCPLGLGLNAHLKAEKHTEIELPVYCEIMNFVHFTDTLTWKLVFNALVHPNAPSKYCVHVQHRNSYSLTYSQLALNSIHLCSLIGGERSHTNPNRHVLYIAVLAGALPVIRPGTIHLYFC